jgi:adenosylcobinamide-phosphate synthase
MLYLFHKFSTTAAVAVEIFIGFYCLSARSLVDEALKVYKRLKEEDLVGARKALAMIVGRDTEILTDKDVICAAVETVAENITDGIVSPLFYLALGGPVAAVAFKAVSTMDSMIGHKNDRYRHFGTFAARLDDVLNFVPARVTGFFLIPFVALILRHQAKNSLRMTLRDRLQHESPNSAHSESAMAGALGIQLGGGACYDGVFIPRPLLGDSLRPAVLKDIVYASHIAIGVSLLATLLSCGILFTIAKGRFL